MTFHQWITKPFSWIALGMIRLYQKLISPMFPASCRFHPTCSEYTCRAIKTHGFFRGSLLGLRRLLRCHPWGDSGIDPVPRREERMGSSSDPVEMKQHQ